MNRTSMSIIDDSGYGLSANSEFIKLFKKMTLNSLLFLIFGGFLALGFIAIIGILFLLISATHINDKSILVYLFTAASNSVSRSPVTNTPSIMKEGV